MEEKESERNERAEAEEVDDVLNQLESRIQNKFAAKQALRRTSHSNPFFQFSPNAMNIRRPICEMLLSDFESLQNQKVLISSRDFNIPVLSLIEGLEKLKTHDED